MEHIKESFSQCGACKHYRGYRECDAYPGPDVPYIIPDDILTMKHDHRLPYPGDHGIRWEAKDPGVKHPLDVIKQDGAELD